MRRQQSGELREVRRYFGTADARCTREKSFARISFAACSVEIAPDYLPVCGGTSLRYANAV
jgi:hypothetical protein